MPYPIDDTQQVGATLPASAPPWSNVTFPPQSPPPATTAPPQTAPPGGPVPAPSSSLAGRLTDPKALLAMILPMLSGLAARGSGGMNSAGALMQGMLKGYLTAQEAKWNRMEFEGQAEQAKFEREMLLMKIVSGGSAHIADLADDPVEQMIYYRQLSEYLENAPAFRGHQDLVRQGLMRPPANAGSRAVAKAADKLVEKLDKDNPAWRDNPENLVNLAETEPVLRGALGAQTAAKKLLALRTTATTPEGGRPEKKPKMVLRRKVDPKTGITTEFSVPEGSPEAEQERIVGAPAPKTEDPLLRETRGVRLELLRQQIRTSQAKLVEGSPGEKKAASFYNRGRAADEIARTFEDNAFLGLWDQARLKFAPNWLQSQDGQSYRQAQRAFTEARLREESGAAIAATEYENDALMYFVQPGDTEMTISQKQEGRQAVIEGAKLKGGAAIAGLGGAGKKYTIITVK